MGKEFYTLSCGGINQGKLIGKVTFDSILFIKQ